MTVAGAYSELGAFADWIRERDDHAAHHLALVAQTEAWLGESGQGAALADKLERWRYQHLNEHAGRLTARDEAFVDALDTAARRLAGRPPRPPRRARHAVRDDACDAAAVERAGEALDPAYPLPELIASAEQLTREHFGRPRTADAASRPMLLYAPLYVSSDCVNYCLYCGFRYPLDIPRKQLTAAEALEQARILRARGFRHLLLVGGEFPRRTTPAYYAEIVATLVAEGFEVAIEIAPQSTEAYTRLAAAGVCGLTLYQETYDEALYAKYHIRGPKASYHWRLESHDRAAEAGVPRLGLGILVGLADPRQDILAMLRHAAYLADRFPDRTLAFSLPRIHEAPDGFQVPYPVADEDLIRFYCALRMAFPAARLVLSTRERAELRNRLGRICITQMSAGSSTAPGGYSETAESVGEQFPISDHRSPAEVADWLHQQGFDVGWTLAVERPR